MKTILLTLSILLISVTNALSQCTFTQNETDDFTGVKRLETPQFLFAKDKNAKVEFTFYKADSLLLIRLQFGSRIDTYYGFDKGDKMIFKFSDSTTTEVYAITYSNSFEGMGWEYCLSSFYVDKQSAMEMSTKVILKIRVYTNDGYYDLTPSIDGLGQFTKNINCILNSK